MSELIKHITAADIEKYGVVAAPDTLTGTPQENKAIFDRLIREMVAGAYNLLVDQVNALLGTETVRETQEAERIKNEAERVAAEALRVAAELLREQAERVREENEAERIAAELERRAVSVEIVENAREEADRAKWEADRAVQIVGGDFITRLEYADDLNLRARIPQIGVAADVSTLEIGGLLFMTDGDYAEGYIVTLAELLAEGALAAKGEANSLSALATVSVANALNLRASVSGARFASDEAFQAKITALCALALTDGDYIADGVLTLSWAQVQGFIIYNELYTETDAEELTFDWCATYNSRLTALEGQVEALRALIGDLNKVLDHVNDEEGA